MNYCCFRDLSELLCACFGMQVTFFLSVWGGGSANSKRLCILCLFIDTWHKWRQYLNNNTYTSYPKPHIRAKILCLQILTQGCIKYCFIKLSRHLCKVCILCEYCGNSGLIHILKKRMSYHSLHVDWLPIYFYTKCVKDRPKSKHTCKSDSRVTIIGIQQLALVSKNVLESHNF